MPACVCVRQPSKISPTDNIFRIKGRIIFIVIFLKILRLALVYMSGCWTSAAGRRNAQGSKLTVGCWSDTVAIMSVFTERWPATTQCGTVSTNLFFYIELFDMSVKACMNGAHRWNNMIRNLKRFFDRWRAFVQGMSNPKLANRRLHEQMAMRKYWFERQNSY